MSFSQSIFDKKEEFYKRFASDFFTKEAWKKMSSYDPKISGFLCGFYTVIKTSILRETSIIVAFNRFAIP